MPDGDREEIVVTGKRRKFVGNHHPVVTLKVDGTLYSTWKSTDIQRSIATLAGGFTFGMSDADPRAPKIAKLAPGSACEVAVDSETLITGYLDDSGPEFDAESHEVRISGRDKAGDLVDCAAYVPDAVPAVWAKGQPVLQVVSAIAKPFGISVKQEVDAGTVSLFALNMGESAFTAIDRICREAGVLPMSDGLGGLVLTRAGLGSRFSALAQGKNILAAKGHVSWRERFSDYYVFADPAGIYVTAQPDGHMGHAQDPSVKRWRPKFVVADFRDTTAANLQKYAEWLATVAAAKSNTPIVVSQGWHDDSGLLWQPNGTLPVTSAKLGIDGDMLVVSTRHIEDDQGSRTELGLAPPDAYKLIALNSGDDLIVPGAGA